VDLDKLVELTKGYSGADIAALVNAAAMSAIKEYIATNRTVRTDAKKVEMKTDIQSKNVPLTISMKHFENALKKIRRNVSMIETKRNLT
jgi:SpoVK/Ycf46/Vps4 family AAA+-type ATPase